MIFPFWGTFSIKLHIDSKYAKQMLGETKMKRGRDLNKVERGILSREALFKLKPDE